MVEAAAVTRGPRGSVVVSPAGAAEVPARPASEVVDVTGAGDLYASGFLHGLAAGAPLVNCAELGSLAAAEVIGCVGARPRTKLARLL